MPTRTVSRAGYGAMIVLLILSALEAYRVQRAVSGRSVELYRQYVKQDGLLFELRENVWRSSVYARDFLLSPLPDRGRAFKLQLQQLRDNSRRAMEELGRLGVAERSRREVNAKVQELWEVLEGIANSKELMDSLAAYEFVQQEIRPRRRTAGEALRQLTEAGQEVLENSELEFAASRRAAALRVLLLLGLSVTVGLLVARFSLKHADNLERERSRQFEEVAQAKRESQQLSVRLLEIQEEERRRLSQELHDEIGQILTALRIEISRSKAPAGALGPEVRERLERAHNLAEKAVETVRDISLLLRPSALDDLGLVPALQWQLADFSRRAGIACEFSENEVKDLLPDSVRTCVYRVVQEALHNCEKHAAAARISVRLRQAPGSLTVEVEDDGRGVDLDGKGMPRRTAGFGVLGMRERAAMVGGSLVFDSSPGRGTRVSLRIPLAEAEA